MSTSQTCPSEVQDTGLGTRHRSRANTHYGTSSTQHLYRNLRKKIFRLQIICWGLGALLLIVTLIWIMYSLKLTSRSGDLLQERINNRALETSLEKLQSDNESLETTLERLQDEVAQLVKGRIPRLLPLELDITIPIERDYFRNVSFTLAGTSQDSYYQYHAVIQNLGTSYVKPDVTVLLFDELGIQVGESRLSSEDDTSGAHISELSPGETRTYVSQIKMDRKIPARYFMVNII